MVIIMVVTATFTFNFEPDTSDIDEVISDKKAFAIDLTQREIDYMLKNKQIDYDDFVYEVKDDNDDHKIGGD